MEEEETEEKVEVVGGGSCGGGGGGIKVHRGGVIREVDDRYALLRIKIVWPFDKFIDVFASLINYTQVLN